MDVCRTQAEETHNAAPLPRVGRTRRLLVRVELALAMFLLVSLLVRYTVADRLFGPSVLFYATPLPLLTAAATLHLVLFGSVPVPSWRRWLRWLLPPVLLAATLSADVGWTTANSASGDRIRVVFWNTSRGHAGWDKIADELRSRNADVVVLVEGGGSAQGQRELWASTVGDGHVAFLGGGMLVLCRGEIHSADRVDRSDDVKLGLVELSVRGQRLTIIGVDVKSTPFYSRRRALREVAELAARHQQQPLLVAGDFNTPTDSVLLSPLRQECRLLFEVAGRGYEPSWPLPLPVLAIDHIWGNDRVRTIDCHLGWTELSDHRPVVVEVR